MSYLFDFFAGMSGFYIVVRTCSFVRECHSANKAQLTYLIESA